MLAASGSYRNSCWWWPRRGARKRVAPLGMEGGACARTPGYSPVGVRLRCSDRLGEQAGKGSSVAWAAPIGRMAFTNYLMQSVIFGGSYGYGLGLFGKLGVAAALAIGTGVYVLQVAFSAYWLQRYLYGPVEWLWRAPCMEHGSL